VAIAAGAVKVIATDGAGSGAAVVDTLDGLEGSLSTLAVSGAITANGGIDVTGTVTADGLTVQTTNGLNALLESTTSYQYLQFKNSAETNNFIGFVSDDFVVSPANNQKMIVTAQGSVGIGTSSPTVGKLQVNDGSGAIVAITRTSGATSGNLGVIRFGNTDIDSNLANITAIQGGSTTSSALTFETQSTGGATAERMRLDSAGTLLVGRTITPPTAGAKIAIAGSGDTAIQITKNGVVAGRVSAVSTGLAFGVDGSDGATERMRIAASGATTVTADTTSDWALAVSNGTNSNAFGLYVNAPSTSGIPLRIDGGGAERFRIDANGSISIPNQNAINELTFTGTEFTNVLSATTSGFNFGTTGAGYLAFITNNSQRMRIDSAGNVDIGGVGNISPYGIRFVINGTGSGGAGLYFGSGVILPTNSTPSLSDNTVDLGQSNYRFNDAFVTNGVTAGSDGNLKQDIAELTDAEQRVAVAAKGLLRKFRWIDAVETKGDDARIHFGIIAQDLQDAFTAEGLDAGRYAMFMSNTWWETQTEVAAVEATEDTKAVDAYTRTDTYDTAEEAPKGATERTRLGIRYSELLAFIISAI
jgi:hypothetical protein